MTSDFFHKLYFAWSEVMRYFDYAATCPLDEDVGQIYIKASSQFYGNSQSLHDVGDQARQLLENCRLELAHLLGVEHQGIYFTSGGSESNFLAIESLLNGCKKIGNHIIIGAAEHASIHSTIARLATSGYEITKLPFNQDGLISLEQFEKAITKETVLAVIQHGNSEIGTIQPLIDIRAICKQNDVLLHSDCVQTFGKIDIRSVTSLVDSFSISGHKIYGPKGTGAVYLRPQIQWEPVFPNTTHEKGFRPGTVNVPGIAAMTAAAQKIHHHLDLKSSHYNKLRQMFIDSLNPIRHLLKIHGSTGEQQIPCIIGMNIKGIEGQWVMLECNRKGFAISTGSACHSGMQSPAKTMTALGFEGKEAKEFFRISLGDKTSEDDLIDLSKALLEISPSQY